MPTKIISIFFNNICTIIVGRMILHELHLQSLIKIFLVGIKLCIDYILYNIYNYIIYQNLMNHLDFMFEHVFEFNYFS